MSFFRCPQCNHLFQAIDGEEDFEISHLIESINDRFTVRSIEETDLHVSLNLADTYSFWEGEQDRGYIRQCLKDNNVPFSFKIALEEEGMLVLVFKKKKEN